MVPQPELPLFTAQLIVQGPNEGPGRPTRGRDERGSAADPFGHEGLAAFTAQLLLEGCGSRDALAFADALDLLGASLGSAATQDGSTIHLQCLSRFAAQGLELMASAVLEARFEEAEIERIRAQWLGALAQRDDDPRRITRSIGARVFFGAEHPYAHPEDGYAESIQSIDQALLQRAHRQLWHPQGAVLLLTGEFAPEPIFSLVEALFSTWDAGVAAQPLAKRAVSRPSFQRSQVVVHPRRALSQTQVRFMLPAHPRNGVMESEYALLNAIFGGAFTSRLMQNLREDKGLSYGASSAVVRWAHAGYWLASASVDAQESELALREFLYEIQRLKSEPPSAEELERAKTTYLSDWSQSFESHNGMLAQLAGMARYGFAPEHLAATAGQIAETSLEQVQALAESLATAPYCLSLVGEPASLLEALEALQLPEPLFCDAWGTKLVGEAQR
jgi:predicted Zn-dependent peptidase